MDTKSSTPKLDSDKKFSTVQKSFDAIRFSGSARRNFLRPDAAPSIWPNLPKYLSKEPTTPRVTNARSESRETLVKAR